jgi:bacterioferritin (cytochrome b1)
MSKDILIKALNQDCADELQAIIQYMVDHMMGEGKARSNVVEMFKSLAMSEMKHYERLAERVIHLGGVPATSVGPFNKAGTPKEMIEKALSGKRNAIKQYRDHVDLAAKHDDPKTQLLLEEILLEEETNARELESAEGE